MGKKYMTKAVALQKIQRFCAYQDRCHSEVRSKLLDMGVYSDELEEIMAELVTERFLDEERFARSYARGKFRLKKWGRQRIVRELKLRRISAYCIKKALTEIEDTDYQQCLRDIILKKYQDYRRKYEAYPARQKAAKYAMTRGYEPVLVWEAIRTLEDQLQ
jgi:regulatory protein